MTGSSVKSIKGVTFTCKIPLVGKYDLSDIVFLFLDTHPTECPIKLPLSVCPSVRPSV